MKPVSVRFKCFGPYMAEQFVDFRELEKNGIFLISGETGSGKTTILDAMCCALYGRASGVRRGGLVNMRCKLAGPEDATLVEFVFDNNGRRFKFVRELKYARKNMHDFHNCMELVDGEFVPKLENPRERAVTELAEEIIGLSAEQFCQVIILPQGQFETFLTSESKEKEKILTTIFNADKWDRIASWINERTKERDARLKSEYEAICTKLGEYSCQDIGQLAMLEKEKSEALEILNEDMKALIEKSESLRKGLEAMIAEDVEFAELDRRKKVFEELLEKSKEFSEEEEILTRADSAEKLRSRLDSFCESRIRVENAEAALREASEGKKKAEKLFGEIERKRDEHAKNKAEAEEKAKKAVIYREKRGVYTSLAEKKKTLELAEKSLAEAEAELREKEGKSAERNKETLDAKLAQDEAISACDAAENRYFGSLGGILAEKLSKGAPCPVCGSTEHPEPARKGDDHISEEEFKSFKKARQEAIDRLQKADEERKKAELQRNGAKETFGKCQGEAAAARKDFEEALKSRIENIETLTGLEKAIRELQSFAEKYNSEAEDLSRKFSEASAELQAKEKLCQDAEVLCEKATKAFGAEKENWEAALSESIFSTAEELKSALLEYDEREERKAELNRKKTELDHAKKELDGQKQKIGDKKRPELEKQKEISKSAEEELSVLEKKQIVEDVYLKKLSKDLRDLGKRLKLHDEERQRVDADLEFSRRISGSNGISLKRYVLGVMMTKITVQANLLLQNVFGGRYRLYRTDDVSGRERKAGLELEVFDGQNGERRSVSTLSGGEKFLVALSLAIGLSSVVQAEGTGVRLEAMFVDEGFGSLSRNSINDAIDILQGVRKSNGIVGIISHVEQLKGTISNCIEITKTENGSVLKQ